MFSEVPRSFVPERLYLEALKNTDDMGENENMLLRDLNSFSYSLLPTYFQQVT